MRCRLGALDLNQNFWDIRRGLWALTCNSNWCNYWLTALCKLYLISVYTCKHFNWSFYAAVRIVPKRTWKSNSLHCLPFLGLLYIFSVFFYTYAIMQHVTSFVAVVHRHTNGSMQIGQSHLILFGMVDNGVMQAYHAHSSCSSWWCLLQYGWMWQ